MVNHRLQRGGAGRLLRQRSKARRRRVLSYKPQRHGRGSDLHDDVEGERKVTESKHQESYPYGKGAESHMVDELPVVPPGLGPVMAPPHRKRQGMVCCIAEKGRRDDRWACEVREAAKQVSKDKEEAARFQ